MVFLGGFETDALHRRGIGRDDPGGRACKLVFEGRTDSRIKILHLFVRVETLAVRGIEHHQGIYHFVIYHLPIYCIIGPFDFFHADLLEFDIFLDTGGFDILGCLLDGIERGIGAVDLMGEIPLVAVVDVNVTPEVGIEIGPFLKSVRRTEDTRGDVAGDKGSFNKESSRAAHGVIEVELPVPSRHEQHACRQHF